MIETDATLGWVPIGAGKTICVLTAIQELLADGYLRSVLVVAPLRVCRHVWAQEAARWQHTQALRVVHVAGNPARRRGLLTADHDIYLLNYELLPWLTDELKEGLEMPANGLVFDEVTKMRAAGSKRFRRFRHYLKEFRWRVGLTGSPQPRNLLDLWGPAFAVGGRDVLGSSFTRYRQQRFRPVDHAGYYWEPLPGAKTHILAALAPIVYQPPQGAVTTQPVLTDDVLVDMKPTGRAHYASMKKLLHTEIDGQEIDAVSAGVMVQKLTQTTAGFLYDENASTHWFDTAKLDALDDMIEDLAGEPVVVVYQHQAVALRILNEQPDARALGGAFGVKTPVGETRLIARWRAGRIPVLLMHPASAGHGIDGLQYGGHHMIFVGLGWDAELMEQTVGRLARSGQPETVYVHRILAADTIDEDIAEVLRDRGTAQAALLRAMKNKAK